MSEDFASLRAQLHQQLADATLLVSKLHGALAGMPHKDEPPPELSQLAVDLSDRANVIVGHVIRWRLFYQTKKQKRRRDK